MSKPLALVLFVATTMWGQVSTPRLTATDAGKSTPLLIYQTQPEYTEAARAARLEGTVQLSIEIDAKGRVAGHHVRVTHSLRLGLDEKAIEAVRHWKFRPAIIDGVPVPATTTVDVRFRL